MMRFPKQFLELLYSGKYFQRSKQKLYMYFSLEQGMHAKNLKNLLRMYKKYWFDFIGLQPKIHSVDTIPLQIVDH
jgi:hypothetical protein